MRPGSHLPAITVFCPAMAIGLSVVWTYFPPLVVHCYPIYTFFSAILLGPFQDIHAFPHIPMPLPHACPHPTPYLHYSFHASYLPFNLPVLPISTQFVDTLCCLALHFPPLWFARHLAFDLPTFAGLAHLPCHLPMPPHTHPPTPPHPSIPHTCCHLYLPTTPLPMTPHTHISD